jgi:curved DNA-binding protein CbpA
MNENYYALLGVSRDASEVTIKRAFRRKALEMHPDTGGSAEAFARLKAAFDCLSDPKRRAQYDQLGPEGDVEARRTREKMLALFSFALDQALLKLRQKPQGVESEKLMALMAEQLRERRAGTANEKCRLETALVATEDILERKDTHNDWLREAVAKRKTFCEERIAAVEEDLKTIDLCMRELLRGATYNAAQAADYGDWIDVHATVG